MIDLVHYENEITAYIFSAVTVDTTEVRTGTETTITCVVSNIGTAPKVFNWEIDGQLYENGADTNGYQVICSQSLYSMLS